MSAMRLFRRSLITAIILILSITQVPAQQRYVVSPVGTVIPVRGGESAQSTIERASGSNTTTARSGLRWGTDPTIAPIEFNFGATHKMELTEWFTAPAAGVLDTLFWMMGPSVGAIDSELIIRMYKSNISETHAPGDGTYPPPCVPWGYWHNSKDLDQGIAAFPEEAYPETSGWHSTVPGSLSSFPHTGVVMWGYTGVPAYAHANAVNFYKLGLPCSVKVGSDLFVRLGVHSLNTHLDADVPTTFIANTVNAPTDNPPRAWVFYEHSSTDTGFGYRSNCCNSSGYVPSGWTAIGGPNGLCPNEPVVFNWWFSMVVTGDAPPNILGSDHLGHTFSTGPRTITATLVDHNPASPTDSGAGIRNAFLVYSINHSAEDSVALSWVSDSTYEADLPAVLAGSTVNYHLGVSDSAGNYTRGGYCRYRIYDINPYGNYYYRLDTAIAFSWIEINSSGTAIDDWLPPKWWIGGNYIADPPQDGGTAGPIDLGGEFRYFDQPVRYTWIGVDGAVRLSMSATDTSWVDVSGDPFPSYVPGIPGGLPANCIAAMYKNFVVSPTLPNGTGHGTIYYQQIGTKFVVEWNNVGAWTDSTDSTTTFELILDRSDNSIVFQYKDVGEYLESGQTLVGLQGPNTGSNSEAKWFFVNRNGAPDETALHNGRVYKLILNNPFAALPGWGMYSAPFWFENPRKEAVFPLAISPAYSYNKRYLTRDTIQSGVGYWLKYPNDEVAIHIMGEPKPTDTVTVVRGWNLIGSVAGPLPVSAIMEVGTSICSRLWTYTGSEYVTSDSIDPGKGYWVKVSGDGMLILDASAIGLKHNNKLSGRILDADMPPPPPSNEPAATLARPTEYSLEQNYPNPFNPSTDVRYAICDLSHVSLKVYDVLGREVATLVDEVKPPGEYVETLHATSLPSGVYFYRISVVGQDGILSYTDTKKMLLMK